VPLSYDQHCLGEFTIFVSAYLHDLFAEGILTLCPLAFKCK
jgi:hypothetical protein